MVEPFDAVDVIRTKRDAGVLSDEQIDWVVDAYTRGGAPGRTLTQPPPGGRPPEVGVSNFQAAHLDAVIAGTGVVPAVNQVEINPYLTQEPLRALHASLGIVTQAWSPLARNRVLGDPIVAALAERVGRTPAQVVLRWHLQRGDVVFPKSTHRERIIENLAVFDFTLDDAAMAELSGLNRDERSGSHPDHVELGTR